PANTVSARTYLETATPAEPDSSAPHATGREKSARTTTAGAATVTLTFPTAWATCSTTAQRNAPSTLRRLALGATETVA
ncbi:hypothetical protein CSHISOI_09221, partial [Colletotrichum shisoi]